MLIPHASTNLLAKTRAIIFAPHPDDETLGCGGLIIQHSQLGIPCDVIVITDGELNNNSNNYREIRRNECLEAAEILGYGAPEFWSLPDGSVKCNESLIARIASIIPNHDLILTPSPLEMHPDHIATAKATIEAIRRTEHRGTIAFYEVGQPLLPNIIIDISFVAMKKWGAIKKYRSQLEVQNYSSQIKGLNKFRTYSLPKHTTYAEAYMAFSCSEIIRDEYLPFTYDASQRKKHLISNNAKEDPLVSVIVRSTGRPCLSDAIKSIQLQNYSHIEIILVSAHGIKIPLDNSVKLGIPIIPHCTGDKLSRSQAANEGLKLAKGTYITFLDEDDLIMPNHVLQLVSCLSKSSNTLAANTGIEVRNNNDEVIDTYNYQVSRAALLTTNHLPINAVLFHHTLIDKGCTFDTEIDLYEDWDFWLQVSNHTPFSHVNSITGFYRAHLGTSGLTSNEGENTREKGKDLIWKKWIPEIKPSDLREMEIERKKFFLEHSKSIASRNFTETELRKMLSEATLKIDEQKEKLLHLENTTTAQQKELQNMNLSLQGLHKNADIRAEAELGLTRSILLLSQNQNSIHMLIGKLKKLIQPFNKSRKKFKN